MGKVLYVGDCSLRVEIEVKGAEAVTNVDRWVDMSGFLTSALTTRGYEVTHMPPHIAFGDFPRTAEDLGEYELLVLSDCGYDTLALYPGQEKMQRKTNRIKEIVKWVERGGGLLYCGGYFSYQGRFGHGKWYGSPLAEILPVEILPIPDDRVEAMEGVVPMVTGVSHPLVDAVDWSAFPPLLGYNVVGDTKPDAKLLATVEGTPFLAVRDVDAGRVVAVTTDPAPHWGVEFTRWDQYEAFWGSAADWATRRLD